MIARSHCVAHGQCLPPRALGAGLMALALTMGAVSALAQVPDSSDARASLELASYATRVTPAHRLTLDVTAGEAEVYHIVVTYPPAFRFRSVQTGAIVGTFEIDVDGDGNPERAATLHAVATNLAFADVIADGTFTPALEPEVRFGEGGIEVRLPFGGDANADTLTAAFSGRLTLALSEGLIANPAIGGRYPVGARVVSVDPDTDGVDDGRGQPPAVQTLAIPIVIDGPPLVRFATLAAEKFHLTPHAGGEGGFLLLGRFVSGQGSDGIDLPREDLSLVVGGFRQTISGRTFRQIGRSYLYLARGPGIQTLILDPDGTFLVDARRLHWDPEWERDPQGLHLALRIGNDEGEVRFAPRQHHRPF